MVAATVPQMDLGRARVSSFSGVTRCSATYSLKLISDTYSVSITALNWLLKKAQSSKMIGLSTCRSVDLRALYIFIVYPVQCTVNLKIVPEFVFR